MSILQIIANNTTSITSQDKIDFIQSFRQLYQLPILRPMLNVAVSKSQNGCMKFKIEPQRSWDRLNGHCETQSKVIKKRGIFSTKCKHIIVIKKICPDIIIHEISHAIEKELKINLNKEFRQSISCDLQQKNYGNHHLLRSVEMVMRNELKNYKLKNVMEELFARYFELIAMSYECGGWGRYQFYYQDMSDFFVNITKWVKEKLNPLLNSSATGDIKILANDLIKKLEPFKQVWTNEIKSTRFHHSNQEDGVGGAKKWSKTIRPILNWPQDADPSIYNLEESNLKEE